MEPPMYGVRLKQTPSIGSQVLFSLKRALNLHFFVALR